MSESLGGYQKEIFLFSFKVFQYNEIRLALVASV